MTTTHLGRDTKWDSGTRDTRSDVDDGDEDLNPHKSTPAEVSSDNLLPNIKFAQVAAGYSCSFVLTTTGLVYGWGAFRDSQDDMRSCFDHNGTIWSWGGGEQNQLGRRPFGRHQDTLTPRRVEVCRGKARYIASGDYHSFAIDAKDNVWGWGLNSISEAGDVKTAGGSFAVLPYPKKVPELCGRGITIIAGGAHIELLSRLMASALSGAVLIEDSWASSFRQSNYKTNHSFARMSMAGHASAFALPRSLALVGSIKSLAERTTRFSLMRKGADMPLALTRQAARARF
ncbi:regulator of chromosome condensation 1/beta-lactamase-inhibitor protein II [Trichoderma barbatum]